MTRSGARTRGEATEPMTRRAWPISGLILAAVLGVGGCSHDTKQASPDGKPHMQGLPSQVADYPRDPEPKLRLSEVRKIGDAHRFALPVGVCVEAQGLLARAEQGHGTARHEVGWYSAKGNNVAVARFDWTDEATFGYYADGFLRDALCLDGGADRSFEMPGRHRHRVDGEERFRRRKRWRCAVAHHPRRHHPQPLLRLGRCRRVSYLRVRTSGRSRRLLALGRTPGSAAVRPQLLRSEDQRSTGSSSVSPCAMWLSGGTMSGWCGGCRGFRALALIV